jgi:hypothetical protein
MRDFRVSPKGILYFSIFLVLFGATMRLDGGTGPFSAVWRLLFWSGLITGSLLLLARLWAFRHDGEAARSIQAKGAYGLLPSKVRDWLFP